MLIEEFIPKKYSRIAAAIQQIVPASILHHPTHQHYFYRLCAGLLGLPANDHRKLLRLEQEIDNVMQLTVVGVSESTQSQDLSRRLNSYPNATEEIQYYDLVRRIIFFTNMLHAHPEICLYPQVNGIINPSYENDSFAVLFNQVYQQQPDFLGIFIDARLQLPLGSLHFFKMLIPNLKELPEHWMNSWQSVRLLYSLMNKLGNFDERVLFLLSTCPQNLTAKIYLVNLIIRDFPMEYLQNLDPIWRHYGYELLQNFPAASLSVDELNAVHPHKHIRSQLKAAAGIEIPHDVDPEKLAFYIIEKYSAFPVKLMDALNILVRIRGDVVWSELQKNLQDAVHQKNPLLSIEKIIELIERNIFPSKQKVQLLANLLELLQKNPLENEGVFFCLFSIFYQENRSIAIEWSIRNRETLSMFRKVNDLIYNALQHQNPALNDLYILAEPEPLSDDQEKKLPNAAVQLIDYLQSEEISEDKRVYISVASNPDDYLNFKELDLLQFSSYDIQRGQTELVRRHFEVLCHGKTKVEECGDQLVLYALIPVNRSILKDPEDHQHGSYYRFKLFAEQVQVHVSAYDVVAARKPIIFMGIANIDEVHFISYFIAKTNNKIQVFIIDPSSRREGYFLELMNDYPMQGSKKLLTAEVITRAFSFIFPGCVVTHLPINQMSGERDCGPLALENIDKILTLAAISNSAFYYDVVEDRIQFVDECLSSLSVGGDDVRLSPEREFLYSEKIKHHSLAVRDKWLQIIIASKDMLVANKANPIFGLFSGEIVPCPPFIDHVIEQISPEVAEAGADSHLERFKLTQRLSELCEKFDAAEIILAFNSEDDQRLVSLIQLIKSRLSDICDGSRERFSCALQINAGFRDQNVRFKYICAAIFSLKILDHFQKLLINSFSQVLQEEPATLNEAFLVLLRHHELIDFYQYLPAADQKNWLTTATSFLERSILQKFKDRISTVITVEFIKNGILQQGAEFSKAECLQELQNQSVRDDEVRIALNFFIRFAFMHLEAHLDNLIKRGQNAVFQPAITDILQAFMTKIQGSLRLNSFSVLSIDELITWLPQDAVYQPLLQIKRNDEQFILDLFHQVKLVFASNFFEKHIRLFLNAMNKYFSTCSSPEPVDTYYSCIRQQFQPGQLLPFLSLTDEVKESWMDVLQLKIIQTELARAFLAELRIKLDLVNLVEQLQSNLTFIIRELNTFYQAAIELRTYYSDLRNLLEMIAQLTRCRDEILKNYAWAADEALIYSVAETLWSKVCEGLKKFLPHYKSGELSPLEFTFYFRRLLTVFYGNDKKRRIFCQILNYENVEEFDENLLTEFGNKSNNQLIKGSLLEKRDLKLPMVTPSMMRVVPFVADESLSYEALTRLVFFWYAFPKTSLLRRQEPDELLHLRRIASARHATQSLEQAVMGFILSAYTNVLDDPTLLTIVHRLTMADGFNLVPNADSIKISAVEFALRCYRERSTRCLAGRSDINIPERQYYELIAGRPSSTALELFMPCPEAIQSLQKWCHQVRKFRQIPNADILLTRFERRLLLVLVRQYSATRSLVVPDVLDCVYLVVAYSLARAFNNSPLHVIGKQSDPGQYSDIQNKMLHDRHQGESAVSHSP